MPRRHYQPYIPNRSMKDKIQLFAEIDLTKTPNETRVMPIDNDPWNDFGYYLEVVGFMAFQAMKYREWSEEKILDYSLEYLEKCIKDYQFKSKLSQPEI